MYDSRSRAIPWQMSDFLSDSYSNICSISHRLRYITNLQTGKTHIHWHRQGCWLKAKSAKQICLKYIFGQCYFTPTQSWLVNFMFELSLCLKWNYAKQLKLFYLCLQEIHDFMFERLIRPLTTYSSGPGFKRRASDDDPGDDSVSSDTTPSGTRIGKKLQVSQTLMQKNCD